MGEYEYELLTEYKAFSLWGCKKCGNVVWNRSIHSGQCVATQSRADDRIG